MLGGPSLSLISSYLGQIGPSSSLLSPTPPPTNSILSAANDNSNLNNTINLNNNLLPYSSSSFSSTSSSSSSSPFHHLHPQYSPNVSMQSLPPQLAYGWWCDVPPPRPPYLWPCLPQNYSIAPPLNTDTNNNNDNNANNQDHTTGKTKEELASATKLESKKTGFDVEILVGEGVRKDIAADGNKTPSLPSSTPTPIPTSSSSSSSSSGSSSSPPFLFRQPPQMAFGWWSASPPPAGPFLWPCIPAGYMLVPVSELTALQPSTSLLPIPSRAPSLQASSYPLTHTSSSSFFSEIFPPHPSSSTASFFPLTTKSLSSGDPLAGPSSSLGLLAFSQDQNSQSNTNNNTTPTSNSNNNNNNQNHGGGTIQSEISRRTNSDIFAHPLSQSQESEGGSAHGNIKDEDDEEGRKKNKRPRTKRTKE